MGEVTDIGEKDGKIYVTTSLVMRIFRMIPWTVLLLIRDKSDDIRYYKEALVNKRLTLEDGSVLLATAGNGFVMLDKEGNEVYALTEQNGLCNNNVNGIYADSSGYVWGATDNGLF